VHKSGRLPRNSSSTWRRPSIWTSTSIWGTSRRQRQPIWTKIHTLLTRTNTLWASWGWPWDPYHRVSGASLSQLQDSTLTISTKRRAKDSAWFWTKWTRITIIKSCSKLKIWLNLIQIWLQTYLSWGTKDCQPISMTTHRKTITWTWCTSRISLAGSWATSTSRASARRTTEPNHLSKMCNPC